MSFVKINCPHRTAHPGTHRLDYQCMNCRNQERVNQAQAQALAQLQSNARPNSVAAEPAARKVTYSLQCFWDNCSKMEGVNHHGSSIEGRILRMYLDNLETCLRKEFDEKLEIQNHSDNTLELFQRIDELEDENKSLLEELSSLKEQTQKENQNLLEELASLKEQTHKENYSIRKELTLLKKALVDALDALAQK